MKFLAVMLASMLSLGSALGTPEALAQSAPPPLRTAQACEAAPGCAPYDDGAPPPVLHTEVELRLTAEDLALLEQGEISRGRSIGGVLGAVYLGFGIGPAIEGRWAETGWIYAVGQGVGSLGLLTGIGLALGQCDREDEDSCRSDHRVGSRIALAGALVFAGFRIAEIVDAAVTPARHNRRVRALRGRLGPSFAVGKVTPYLAPAGASSGVAGVALSF